MYSRIDNKGRRSVSAPAICALCLCLLASTALRAASAAPESAAPAKAPVTDYRIRIAAADVVRIRYADFLDAGIDPALLAGDTVRVFCRSQEVALAVSRNGPLQAGDDVRFYAIPHDGYYTRTNTYWVGLGGAGRRMQGRPSAPLPGAPLVTSHEARIALDRNRWYLSLDRPADDSLDHWFDSLLTSAWTNFIVNTDDAVPGTARLEATVMGWSDVSHVSMLRVNGTRIDSTFSFAAREYATRTLTFDATLLESSSEFSFRQGDALDFAWLERFALSYPCRLAARNNRLVFTGETGRRNYLVAGLTGPGPFAVYDISDPVAPVELNRAGLVITNLPSGPGLLFGDETAAAATYLVTDPATARLAPALEPVAMRHLADPARQADYIIICPRAFRWPAYRLLRHRRVQGLRVAVAPIEDVYNEFNFGIPDAAAIRAFIAYAVQSWQPPAPRYVLLAGWGGYDPQDNLDTGAVDRVPVHLGPTTYEWTALDPWFACVAGDDAVADVAIGRIPARTSEELAIAVEKIIRIENQGGVQPTSALLVADNHDGIDFRASSEALRHSQLGTVDAQTVYLDDGPYASDINTARGVIQAAFGADIGVVNYFGHGAIDSWATEDILTVADTHQLPVGGSPIVSVFTCQNGYFHDPVVQSLADALLLNGPQGAIACLAPSSLSVHANATDFADGFFRGLVSERLPRLGDAWLTALNDLHAARGNVYELLFYHVLGDPALLVNPHD